MDTTRFDRLAVSLAERASRRRMVSGLTGGALALVLSAGLTDAKKKRKGKAGKGNRKTRPFHSNADGQVTNAGEPGCQFDPGQCTTAFAGSGKAGHLGTMTFTSSLTADWTQATSNDKGGFCAPMAGTAVLTARVAKRGSLELRIRGLVCEVGASVAGGDLEMRDATYAVLRGTGPLLRARGRGDATGTVAGEGKATFRVKGELKY